ncbi:hypothetical protein PV10_01046 [Exophiala mesophila]|uniref:Zn(2)-C6 fungal-type domain-containing protein n=1 Tax=Exophiala mesophila TaxID=212818 RepID=A0A0D2AED7_EXOME|nr:uncharacterized protein PV10_01046 [Exophiala mesophila]KIV97278.1 hypothetical protein PV10_01046 [Exophiala mesophila]
MERARLRDQRPCDNCRRRKIRCLFPSDEATDCVLCISRSTSCTYIQTAPRKRRVISPGSDQNQLGAASGPRQRALSKRSPDHEVLSDYTKLPGRSLLKETLGHQNRQSSTVIGATSDFAPSLASALSWNAKGECLQYDPPNILRRANQSTYFIVRPDTREETEAELANLDAIEDFVAPHGPELVNLYFRIVHPSFPILHKRVFLEKYGRSYRELTPCGLGAVYVMALNWWSYSPALATALKPDVQRLEDMVLNMLFQAHRRPKISDLQGALVLMQRPSIVSWSLIGHVVAMGQDLGINSDCTAWQVPDWERGVRKRVAWALFMQDKWGALVYGRGSHIRKDDWDVATLDSSDFPETARDDDDEEGSAEIEKGKHTFLQMVALTEIIADILDQFYTLKAASRTLTIAETLEVAKPLQLRLKNWFSNVPTSLSIDDTVPRKLSSVGYLHLAYYTAEVTLHRAILRPHDFNSPMHELYSITRRSATARFTSALAFVKRLRAEHFQSFWYFSSTLSLAIIGLFAGILCATIPEEERDERTSCLSSLAEYRWVLRISATSADFLKSAVSMLDGQSRLIDDEYGPDLGRSTGAPDMQPLQEHANDDGTQNVEHYGHEPPAVDFFTADPYYSIDWSNLDGLNEDYLAMGSEIEPH